MKTVDATGVATLTASSQGVAVAKKCFAAVAVIGVPRSKIHQKTCGFADIVKTFE